MYFLAILAALLISTQPGMTGRDAACRVSGSVPAQAAAEENPQKPATEHAPEKGSDAQPSENKAEETPPATKAEEPNAQKPPSTPVANGARKRHARTKKKGKPTPNGEPRKVVIHQGGSNEPVAQILPGMTPEEASHQRDSAEQLLAAAETSLDKLSARSLKPHQQGVVVQIRQYMDGARAALKENDPQRAHTLALKAYLLLDDLVKH